MIVSSSAPIICLNYRCLNYALIITKWVGLTTTKGRGFQCLNSTLMNCAWNNFAFINTKGYGFDSPKWSWFDSHQRTRVCSVFVPFVSPTCFRSIDSLMKLKAFALIMRWSNSWLIQDRLNHSCIYRRSQMKFLTHSYRAIVPCDTKLLRASCQQLRLLQSGSHVSRQDRIGHLRHRKGLFWDSKALSSSLL